MILTSGSYDPLRPIPSVETTSDSIVAAPARTAPNRIQLRPADASAQVDHVQFRRPGIRPESVT